MVGVLHDVDGALVGEHPDGLGRVRQKRHVAEQALVPPARRREVAHRQAGEQRAARPALLLAHPRNVDHARARAV
jgi:hypothetical protein